MDKGRLIKELMEIVGEDGVLSSPAELITYECDGLTITKSSPEVVVIPRTTDQVARILKVASREKVPFVARGAGTGLSGGCIPTEGGIVISTARMDRVLQVDLENRMAVVEPGLVNLALTEAVREKCFYYAPDPSSQQVCTIGGNIAENSGGPHTLKYGVTANHVLGLEVVLPDGTVAQLGGSCEDPPGYDLRGLFVGSEGTLGIVTRAVVTLKRLPEAVATMLALFPTVDDASNAVSRIIAEGIVPAALEMIDRVTMEAVEPFIKAGYPTDAGAVLLIELDGLTEGLKPLQERIHEICISSGAKEMRLAGTEAERYALWAGRKAAFGAYGRISSGFYVMDGVVPRSHVPKIMKVIAAVAEKYNLTIANVMHAGDGNIHPNILFKSAGEEQVERAVKAAEEILRACVEMGGTLSGEHGIGIEKRELMPLLFSDDDLEAMKQVRGAFDPLNLSNPEKVFPCRKGCMEVRRHTPVAAGWI